MKIYNQNKEEIKNAEIELDKNLMTLYKNKLIKQTDINAIKNNIIFNTDINKVVKEATFIIDAVPEDLEIKRNLYQKISNLIKKDTILASNTSGFTLKQLTEDYQFIDNFIITHFWNPAHLIPLVEIVKNKNTSLSTIERIEDIIKSIRKKPIIIQKEVLGFLGNRLQCALFREAQSLLDHGIASKEDIDAAVTYSVGRRYPVIGPLMTADLGGLDIFSNISNYLFEDLSNDKNTGKSLNKRINDGDLGYKTGKGFYDWNETLSRDIINKRDEMLMYFLKEDRENDGMI